MAFVVEGLLFAFHLEGSELNWKAHLLLVMSIFAAVGAILGEIVAPGNVLLGLARAQLVMLQGVWFMQIAKLLFEGVFQQSAAHSATPAVVLLWSSCIKVQPLCPPGVSRHIIRAKAHTSAPL